MKFSRARFKRNVFRKELARGFFPALLLLALAQSTFAQLAASSAPPPSTVTIVLPPHVVAGQPATLAVLAGGKLAPGVDVDLGNDLRVRTDPVGRAYFTVPSGTDYLIAKAQGASAATLVDNTSPSSAAGTLDVPAQVSIADIFPICGQGFQGDAESNRVTLGGEPALVLAASPECFVVLASNQSMPGLVAVSVKTGNRTWAGATDLVSLRYESAQPPLAAQKKSRLRVFAEGTREPVRLSLHNETPGVLQFTRGDDQATRTSGGEINVAEFEVVAIRSGNYSFRAQIVESPRAADAVRFLNAAEPLASQDLGKQLRKLSGRLKHHPRDAEKLAPQLDAILKVVVASNLRTLLVAARNCL